MFACQVVQELRFKGETVHTALKNNLKIIFFLNTLLFHIQYKILSKLKKIESASTSPMDWLYKEK